MIELPLSPVYPHSFKRKTFASVLLLSQPFIRLTRMFGCKTSLLGCIILSCVIF